MLNNIERLVMRRGDRVFTPEWVAKDMVESFSPSGRILELGIRAGNDS